ncbi:unnamed protein product [Mytilus coruscus]|uniref:Uncharacterized protein n=1 Tax=Mytilus coruscus TaxID=42192 RepID=A0A6J8ARB5_MYTCO|nr:unnamed protein product [Mytilus coruscus]
MILSPRMEFPYRRYDSISKNGVTDNQTTKNGVDSIYQEWSLQTTYDSISKNGVYDSRQPMILSPRMEMDSTPSLQTTYDSISRNGVFRQPPRMDSISKNEVYRQPMILSPRMDSMIQEWNGAYRQPMNGVYRQPMILSPRMEFQTTYDSISPRMEFTGQPMILHQEWSLQTT